MVCLAQIFSVEILPVVLLLVEAISLYFSTACLVPIAFVEIQLVVLALNSLLLLIETISLAEFGLFLTLTAYLAQIFSIFYRF